MPLLRTALVLALAAGLSGCFQVRTLVRLHADGSGTVEEHVVMNAAMQVLLQTMDLEAEFGRMNPAVDGDVDGGELEARARRLGAAFVGVEERDVLFGEGYVATYAFERIADLRLDSDPLEYLPEGFRADLDLPPAEPITFDYEAGRLAVTIPPRDLRAWADEGMDEDDVIVEVETAWAPFRDPKKAPLDESEIYEADSAAALLDEETRMGFAFMFRDLRLTLAIELPREVARTNASFLSGRTLTLYDLDLDVLAEDPEAVVALDGLFADAEIEGADPMALLATLPGVVYEPEAMVTVAFE